MKKQIKEVPQPNRVWSYFKLEMRPLLVVTVSGIFYNVGMIAGPYFEGQLAQCLYDIIQGYKGVRAMVSLAGIYLIVILAVQAMRCVKRFYVRRFANDTSRNMRHMLYNSLVNQSTRELKEENIGEIMTKAVSDVDTCVEGMRKFTTEVFDTGVVLIAYVGMLLYYDWRLTLLAGIFTPAAYLIAGRLKTCVTRYNARYKKSAGRLNEATMDRISNAITYRVYGCEENRDMAYENYLRDYEKCAVSANIWESSMQPIYNIISMCGAVMIVYLGTKNVLGSGWTGWNIAAFTTFLSCFTKMALKSSKAAKLFNSVQKAEVSWKRIKPLMNEYVDTPKIEEDREEILHKASSKGTSLSVSHLCIRKQDGEALLKDISFFAKPGQIIGVTGAVACGKSSLGKVLIGEVPYEGSICVGERELSSLTQYERSSVISYMGHEPELMSDSIRENIQLGDRKDCMPYLKIVCLDQEIGSMPDKDSTFVGNGGARLSGGQQARLALARTLYHAKGILILDDPFSAVDRKTEQMILEQIRMLAKDRIVILISHRLYLFPEFDQILFLEQGTGIFSSHEEMLKKSSAYANLYQAQTQKGGEEDER